EVAAGVEARVDGAVRLVGGDAAVGVGGDVAHPLVDDVEGHRRLGEGHGRPGVGEPDDLVGRVAVGVEHALAGGEGLLGVVHVQLVLEVVPPVDDRDVDVAHELHARGVGGVHRVDVARSPGRRRGPPDGAGGNVGGGSPVRA